MQALIIDREAKRLDHSLISLMQAEVQVTGTCSLLVAETCIMHMGVDLLVIEKSTIGNALGDTLGMAEDRNPHLVAILRTPDVARDQEELCEHYASLHCVVGQEVPNEVAVKLGLASLRARITRSTRPARATTFKRRVAPESLAVPAAARPALPVRAYADAL